MNIKPPIKYGFYTYFLAGSFIMVSLFLLGFMILIIAGKLWILWWLPAICILILLWLWYRGGMRTLKKGEQQEK